MINGKKFYFWLALIVIAGVGLRLIHYDSVPGAQETTDELLYPWAGM